MAGKVKMPNKKTTITVAIIIAILAVVIAIGTVCLLYTSPSPRDM